jgi:hypothetical protein
MLRRLTLEIDDHYRERPEALEAFVLQLLRQVTGKTGAHDALELVAWAQNYALANRFWDLYHEIGEMAIPLRRQGATVPEGSFMSRNLGSSLTKKEAPAGRSESTSS